MIEVRQTSVSPAWLSAFRDWTAKATLHGQPTPTTDLSVRAYQGGGFIAVPVIGSL